MTTCSLGLGAEAHSAGEKAILETALRLFSELGFEGVSMRAVAREAGVSKSNICQSMGWEWEEPGGREGPCS